ncbi:hypothetical protein [Macrococcoides bohemicum]|uniref:hypothetical protein n=1 Tax=Macrococcoides bohemicum TaxID=1903056 RepID=UPI00165E6F3D|nr:hypothetical protein [Macrococcus bohemicus]MBC9875566.1 hypothetical protein [Macrococcus bohemicus]
MNFLIRNIDEGTYYKLKSYSENNEVSMNELVNLILDKAIATNELRSFTQELDDDMKQLINVNNNMINVLKEQSKTINEMTDVIKKLID